MSVTSQFDGDASAVKAQIEAAYEGDDDVQGTEKEAGTYDSPLCVV